MNIKDKLQVQTWLRSNATWEEVQAVPERGLVGNVRFSPKAKRLFFLLWAWSTHRFTGRAAAMQDRAYLGGGLAAVNRRIARCNAIIERLKHGR